MPRKSAAELSIVPLMTKPVVKRLEPGDHVPEEAQQVFREINASLPADHIRPETLAMFEAYCTNIVLLREVEVQIQIELEKPRVIWAMVNSLHMLKARITNDMKRDATALQLTPLSRRGKKPEPLVEAKKPWER